MSYDIDNEAYSSVGFYKNSIAKYRCIASSKEKLYVFEKDQIFEMTNQFERLDVITFTAYLKQHHISMTNRDGIIFQLQKDGKMTCFDPFGKRKLKEVQDLDED